MAGQEVLMLRRRSSPSLLRLVAALLLLGGCSSGSTPVPDADVTPPSPDAAVPDKGPPRPDQDQTPVLPLPIKEWMVATFSATTTEQVWSALEQGTFTLPAAGPAYGLNWTAMAPAADGTIMPSLPSGKYLYAAALVDTPTGRRVLGRFDSVMALFAGGAQLPGDVYGSKKIRLPVATQPGQTLVVVQGMARGTVKPAVELQSVLEPVVLNPLDATLPDLIAGELSSELWLGVPALNLTDAPVLDLTARVEPSALFDETTVSHPALPAGAVSPLAFQLKPKAATATDAKTVKVAVRVESASLPHAIRVELELPVVASGSAYRRTFRSAMDGSAQYYGVLPPKSFDAAKSYSLVLSLHGASVEASGQAAAYSARDWAYIIAATNRRPFGFDWEEFGTVDALEVLEHARGSFKFAADSVYLTGHSMGGHGTNHMGVLFPGLFAAMAPSAGWISFYTYAGSTKPTGAVARARAASSTLDYVGNVAKRAWYLLHGDKDDNVPLKESQDMAAALQAVTPDATLFVQPGAGHWWDGDAAPGVDCVDWLPIFEMFQKRKLDPVELDFKYTTPSPYVNAKHSYVTIRSAVSAYKDCTIESKLTDTSLALTTTNVRGLVLDGKALAGKGVTDLAVDGKGVALADGPVTVGPQDGKRADLNGPLNQAFQRPFCLVYPDASVVQRRYAAYLASTWAVIGNGAACAVPVSKVTSSLRADRNLIYLGVARADLTAVPTPITWDDSKITVGSSTYAKQAVAVVFPEGQRLSAAFFANAGAEYLLFRYHPFTSRSGMPDYFVWGDAGRSDAGFFTPDWTQIESSPP
jgi:poly(3-hydroxybutyrate) depolymerase